MKGIFQFVLAISVFLYRLTHGKFGGHVQGLPVLLLTTRGRKTGKERTRPIGYFMDNGDYVITASNAGFKTQPAWFHNPHANPRVTIEVKDRQMEAVAEIAAAERRVSLWSRLISLAPGYANYAKRSSREIPLIILHPLNNE